MSFTDESVMDENEEYDYLETRIHSGSGKEDADTEEIGYVTAPIDSIGPLGRWIRHRLLESILYGTPVLIAIQHMRSKRITRYMKIASILGTEEAYCVILCFLLWIVDMRLARLTCIAMALGFYAANSIKNCLCLPRPPSPPVKPLENAYYTWGLPSHHSVLAVISPWYIWFYCLLHYHFEFATFVCLFTLVVIWSSSVLMCRIYNGVHSPADVVTGGLIGCIVVAVMSRYDNLLDLSMNGQGVLLTPVYAGVMLFLHPFNEVGLAAFVETNSMVSTAVGFMLARGAAQGRLSPLKNVMEMYEYGKTPLLLAVGVSIARIIIGAIIVLLTKVIMKKVSQAVIGLVLRLLDIKYYTKSQTSLFYTGYNSNYRLPPIYSDKKKASSEEEAEREKERRLRSIAQQDPWNISHAVRFVTYICMGFNAYYSHNAVCQYIGLVL